MSAAVESVLACPELVDNICSQSSIDNIGRLRLTCRSSEALTWHAFKRRGFSTKSFAITQPGLERFLEITQHERLVHELTSVRFCSFRQSFRLTLEEQDDAEAHFNAERHLCYLRREEYVKRIEEVRTRRHTRAIASLLERAFFNIARLGARLEVFIWALGSKEDGAESFQDRAFDYAHGHSLSVRIAGGHYNVGFNDALTTILRAIATTKAIITRIHAPECVVPDEIMRNKKRLPHDTTFPSSFSSLGIGMPPCGDSSTFNDTDRWACFERFLARAPLRRLSLFSSDQTEWTYNAGLEDIGHPFWEHRKRFLASATYTSLEEIAFIERIGHDYQEKEQLSHFAPFLHNHSTTLRKVVISMQFLQESYINQRGGRRRDLHGGFAISAIGQALSGCGNLESLRLEGPGVTLFLDDCDRVFPKGCYSSAWTGTIIPTEHGPRSRRTGYDNNYPLIICYDKHSGHGEIDQPSLSEFLQWMSEHTDRESDDEFLDEDDDDDDDDPYEW